MAAPGHHGHFPLHHVRGHTRALTCRNCHHTTGLTLIECSHPIRSAITVAGIRGNSAKSPRTRGSTASTSEPLEARRYFGGSSETNAARTVFLATPRRRAISLIATPSALYNRRISAQSSTEITLQYCRKRVNIHPTPRGHYSSVVDNIATPWSPHRRRSSSDFIAAPLSEWRTFGEPWMLNASLIMSRAITSLWWEATR